MRPDLPAPITILAVIEKLLPGQSDADGVLRVHQPAGRRPIIALRLALSSLHVAARSVAEVTSILRVRYGFSVESGVPPQAHLLVSMR